MLIHNSDGDNDDDDDDDGDDGDDLSSWHTQATHVGHPSCHPAPSNLSLGIPQAIFHESGEIKPSWQPISLHHRQIVKIMFFRQAWWEPFKGDDEIVDIGKGDDDDDIGKGDDDDHRQRLFGTSTPVQHQIWTAVEKAHLHQHLWAKILSIDIKQLLPFLSNL